MDIHIITHEYSSFIAEAIMLLCTMEYLTKVNSLACIP